MVVEYFIDEWVLITESALSVLSPSVKNGSVLCSLVRS